MRKITDCIDKKSGKDFSFSKSEEGITFTLKSITNQKFNCNIVSIDECVFGDEQIRRCDWLFLVADMRKAYYVELKGINIDEACEQLYNAIDRTKTQIPNFDIQAKVISTKGQQPEILNSKYYRKVKRLIKKDIEFKKVVKAKGFTHIETI
jgi:hypothetical protein